MSSNWPINPKPIALRRMFFFVLQMDGGMWFAVIQFRLTFHQFRTLKYLFLSLTIERRKRKKSLIVCSVLAVSLKTTM
jgi:hypothetical protein